MIDATRLVIVAVAFYCLLPEHHDKAWYHPLMVLEWASLIRHDDFILYAEITKRNCLDRVSVTAESEFMALSIKVAHWLDNWSQEAYKNWDLAAVQNMVNSTFKYVLYLFGLFGYWD